MQTALIKLIIELIKSHIRIGEMGETAADGHGDAQYHKGYQDGLRVALKAIEECVEH